MLVKIALTSQHVDEENPKLDVAYTEAFLLNTDGSKYVRLNKLKEGDEVGFYRLRDPDSGQTNYVLRPLKNSGDLEPSSDAMESGTVQNNSAPARGPDHFPLQICKDKKEAEVWFSKLKALISRGHQRKWITESKTDGILSGAASPTKYTRSSPLKSPFGSADGLQKDGANHLDIPYACLTKSGLDKTFLNVTFSSVPACPSVSLFSSGGSDVTHSDMKGKGVDAFTVNLSSAVGSKSRQDSGHADIEKDSTGIRPCFLINHPTLQPSKIYYPFSDQCDDVDVRIARYNIIGQSTPGAQRGNWFIMCHQDELRTMFYDGHTTIRLPSLPDIPFDTKLLACYWGNPGGDCRVLILAFMRNHVKCFPYSSGVWATRRALLFSDYDITFASGNQRPVGHITTRDGFSWVDANSGCLYVYEDLWARFNDNEVLRTPRVADMFDDNGSGEIFLNSKKICSVVQGNEFRFIIAQKHSFFEVYRLSQIVDDMIDEPIRYVFEEYSLQPGEGVFGSSDGPGILMRVPEQQSQQIYLGTWANVDVIRINMDDESGLLNQHLIRDCHQPIGRRRLCLCSSYVIML